MDIENAMRTDVNINDFMCQLYDLYKFSGIFVIFMADYEKQCFLL
jgi:hypothetical protein